MTESELLSIIKCVPFCVSAASVLCARCITAYANCSCVPFQIEHTTNEAGRRKKRDPNSSHWFNQDLVVVFCSLFVFHIISSVFPMKDTYTLEADRRKKMTNDVCAACTVAFDELSTSMESL